MTEAPQDAPNPELEKRWARIRMRMEDNAEDLLTQGVLVPKVASGRRYWVVRFVDRRKGRPKHRSIYVGGDDQPELLRRTRRLLEEYRNLGGLPEQIADSARIAAKLNVLARGLGALRR